MRVRTKIHSGTAWYTVKEGDTLTSIAISYYGEDVTPQEVSNLYANNVTNIGIDPCVLKVGMTLAVPTYDTTPSTTPSSDTNVVGACTTVWKNNVCQYISCPYPPYKYPCDSGVSPVPPAPPPPVPVPPAPVPPGPVPVPY